MEEVTILVNWQIKRDLYFNFIPIVEISVQLILSINLAQKINSKNFAFGYQDLDSSSKSQF